MSVQRRFVASVDLADRSRDRTSARLRERGVAILSVVTVLVALILIAIPFVISQKLGRDRTESSAARSRALFEADLVCRAVTSYLHRTYAGYEEEARKNPGSSSGAFGDERVDSLDEFTPPPSFRQTIADYMRSGTAAPGMPTSTASLEDPRGSIWSWRVVDANALVNPNGASPYLLGNLLGSGTLAADLDGSSGEISIQGLMPNDPSAPTPFKREGGWIRIGSEVVEYRSFDGTTFRDCKRGALRDTTTLRDNGSGGEHKKGEIVIDYTAWKLATHIVNARAGTFTPFSNLEDLKTIQGWGKGGVLDADRLESLIPFITVWSRHEGVETFLNGQLVINALPENSADGTGETIKVRDRIQIGGSAAYFNPGTILRVTDGIHFDYLTVAHAGDEKGGQIGSVFTTAGKIPEGRSYEGGKTQVQPLAPYPIDINTASRAVLAAVMGNLRLRGVEDLAKDVVTPKVALDLADLIIEGRKGQPLYEGEQQIRRGGPFRDAKDVATFLDELLVKNRLTQKQVSALVRNAVNPHDAELAFGTAPFCYRTLDVYTIEGRAVINNAAGEKIAEAALRQVVEIGADQATTWTLDSQMDFEAPLCLGSGGKYVETFPFNVAYVTSKNYHDQPRLRAPQMVERHVYPSTLDADPAGGGDLGDVRNQPMRLVMPGKPTLEEHNDTAYHAEGYSTEMSGPYSKPVNELLRKNDLADPYVHPFTLSMWMKPYSSGNWFAFDTGHDNYRNRVSLFVQDGKGGSGKELVFRVSDSTLEERGAEIYVPLQRLGYSVETWYHLQAMARGCDPAQMDLLIDGVAVGRHRGLTALSAGLSMDSTSVQVEDTDGFVAPGAVLIGDEVIEYQTMTASGFTDCVRGTRGTPARDWNEHMPVKIVGYSHPLILDLRKGGAGLDGTAWSQWGFVNVSYVGKTDAHFKFADGTQITFQGATQDETSFDVALEIGLDELNENAGSPEDPTFFGSTKGDVKKQAETFNDQGFAVLTSTNVLTDTSTPPPTGALLATAPMALPPGVTYVASANGGGVLVGAPAANGPGGGPQGPGPVGGVSGGRPGGTGGTTGGGTSGGGTSGGGTSGGTGGPSGSVPPAGTRAAGSGELDVPKVGGWEVVYYKRAGDPTKLTITRYQSTKLHQDSGVPYFMATKAFFGTASSPTVINGVVTRLAPISFVGVSAGKGGFDYLDPANDGNDKTVLGKYRTDGEPGGKDTYSAPRVAVGADTKKDATEVMRYDSIDRTHASGRILFVRDDNESLKTLVNESLTTVSSGLMGSPLNLRTGNTTVLPTPPTTPVPGGTPTPTPTPTPVPAPSTPGNPNGSIPPGLRPPGATLSAAPNSGGGVGRGRAILAEARPFPAPGAGPILVGDSAGPIGGVQPGIGRDPVPDESGGGGTPPTPADGSGNLPPGLRPPVDPVPTDTGTAPDPNARYVPRIDALRGLFPFRGACNTVERLRTGAVTNANDGLFLPCFRVLRKHDETLQPIGGPPPGLNDVVTLSTGVEAPRREQHRVRWAHAAPKPAGQTTAAFSTSWLCLNEFIDGEPYKFDDPVEWRVDYRGKTRLMKFPSGEMPDEHGENVTFGKNEVGGGDVVKAYFDEMFVWRHDTYLPMAEVVNTDTITSKTKEFTLRAIPPLTSLVGIQGYDKDVGVLDVDGELIVYRGSHDEGGDRVVFEDCRRGVYGTKARPHAMHTMARFVPEMYVSCVDGSVSRDASTIAMRRTKGWPAEGTVRIVGDDTIELIHYTGITDAGLMIPESLDGDSSTRGRGLFRGRFGTDVTNHDTGDLVLWQPSRFWDRYTPRRGADGTAFAGIHDHPESAYVEFAKTVRNAQWRAVRWEYRPDDKAGESKSGSKGGRSSRGAEKRNVIVVARFDQGVPWDSKAIVDLRGTRGTLPADVKDHAQKYLYVFDTPEAANQLDFEANIAEFRVYFAYTPASYVAQDFDDGEALDQPAFENAWKTTPKLQSFSVEYVNRTRVRYQAEIR